MGKQYNFKTTRTTSWMEDILDNMSNGDRSLFIREAVSEHMYALGMANRSDTQRFKAPTVPDSASIVFQKKDKGTTNETQKKDDSNTNVFQTEDKSVTEEPPEIDVKEVSMEDSADLDSALDNISFDN